MSLIDAVVNRSFRDSALPDESLYFPATQAKEVTS